MTVLDLSRAHKYLQIVKITSVPWIYQNELGVLRFDDYFLI